MDVNIRAHRARPGIFLKILLALVLAAVIPLGITWYYARARAIEDANRLATLQLDALATQLTDKVEAWLRLNIQSMSEHAAMPPLQSMNPETQRPVLIAMTKLQPWSFLAQTVSPNGMSLSRSDGQRPVDYADRRWFSDAFSGKAVGQQIIISRTNNKPSWSVSVPIRTEGGRVIGVLNKSNALSDITDVLVEGRVGRSGRAMLLSPDGKLVAMTGGVRDNELKDLSKHAVYVASSRDQAATRFEEDNQAWIARVRRTYLDWVVAVQLTENEVFEGVRRTDLYMLKLLGVATLIAIGFAAAITPGIARPIRRLTFVTEEISRGKFDHTFAEAARSDEIGALARSIERMTNSLRIAMNRLASRR